MPDAAPTNPAPAWRDGELANPHLHGDKPAKVRRMFAAIAGSYDLNNRLHSMWQDQRWRRRAVRAAAVNPGDSVLDVACGTGDLTGAFARTHAAKVVGLDFTREMLDHAREKQRRLPTAASAKVSYIEGDAQALPFDSGSFDVVSIAFGIRNVADPRRALGEFARVLRPGGRLVVLEFDRPGFAPMRWFHNFYCARIMPRTATLISGDTSGAYRYLPASVGTFMERSEMVRAIGATGFRNVHPAPLTGGICVCYSATRE